MKNKGITGADVARACIALKLSRRRISAVNIRLELGRGSYSTISKHLKRLALTQIESPQELLLRPMLEEPSGAIAKKSWAQRK